jgi:hypothetical protein
MSIQELAERFRWFAEHHEECAVFGGVDAPPICTCGYDAMLAQLERLDRDWSNQSALLKEPRSR